MKILLTNLFLFPKKVGGSENYIYNLLDGIQQNNYNKNIDLVVNENILDDCDDIVKNYNNVPLHIKYNRGIYDYFLNFFVEDIKKYKIIFSPNYITPLFFRSNIKKITTIYDVQYLHFPEFFTKKKRLWLYLSHWITLKLADKVICISENVKNDLLHFFGEQYRKKLEVIYIPIDFKRFDHPQKLNTTQVNKKYILSVAAQYPHKNLLTLVKAFNRMRTTKYDYKLVLAGQLGKNLVGKYETYSSELQIEIDKNIDNIIVTGYVSNEHLGNLYKNCEMFVFPSLFEGFGMPPVEAMGLGKPTITTRCASLEEVTLNKAIYMNHPKDDKELERLIKNTIDNLETYQKEFKMLRGEIREKYTPKYIAQQYINVFEKMNND